MPIQPLDETIRFAPNPATYAVTLLPTQPFEAATISIYAIDGQLIQRIEHVQAVEYNLNVEQLAPGVYIIRISDGKRQYTNKLIRA